jgi:hypothetical protein
MTREIMAGFGKAGIRIAAIRQEAVQMPKPKPMPKQAGAKR